MCQIKTFQNILYGVRSSIPSWESFWRVQHANLYELIDDDWWPYHTIPQHGQFIIIHPSFGYATHHYGHKENLWAYGVGTIFSQWPLRTDGIWEPHIVFFCMARHCTYLHNCTTPSLQHSYGFWMQNDAKSAHTALAVKACLLGGNSNTKCSMTFVNIAVAISALAGGGGQKRFRTETRIRWCFRHFSRIFGRLSARGYWNGILGHFGSFPAMEKRPKMKKTLYIARFCSVFGRQSIENTAKTSVLDWRYSKKRVNYRMLDWKHYKNTVKSNVLEGFTAFMAKNV